MENNNEAAPIAIAIVYICLLVFGFYELAQQKQSTAPASLNESYLRAVHESVQPVDLEVSHSLYRVNLHQPLVVVAWMNHASVAKYQQATTAPKDTWVTAAPKLKSFCQEYVRFHGSDPNRLTLRLEQRLGLPPETNPQSEYDSLVELELQPAAFYNNGDPAKKLFRPCGDPSLDTVSCALASSAPDPDPKNPDQLPRPPRTTAEIKTALEHADNYGSHQFWFLSKYYGSFASIPTYQYPWTSLGYTFDWAPKEDGSGDFVRWGESEFVLPAETPIKFLSATSTAEYCTPQ